MHVEQARTPGLVSIVIPCYNAGPFVAETLESALAQTYPHREVIVVDDASTDESREVVARFADRVTVLNLEKNGGGSRARNRGAALARGEFLMFLDADDLLAPEAVEGLVEALRAQDGEVAGCRWQRLKEVGGEWRVFPTEIPLPDPASDPLAGWMAGKSWFPPCAVLWRREAYDRTGGWDEALSLNDDGDLMMRALLDGARLVVAGRGEARYRWHGASRITVSTNVFSERKLLSQRRVLEKLEHALAERGRLAEYAEPLGVAYQYVALLALGQGFPEIGEECQRRGELLAGNRPVSRTLPGRLLTRVIGVERKERLALALARLGLATRERRRFGALLRVHGAREAADA